MGANDSGLFASLYTFRERDLLTKEQFDSYRAMLILLRTQYTQQRAMIETALQHNRAHRHLIEAWKATKEAILDVEGLLGLHTVASNAQKDKRKEKVSIQ